MTGNDNDEEDDMPILKPIARNADGTPLSLDTVIEEIDSRASQLDWPYLSDLLGSDWTQEYVCSNAESFISAAHTCARMRYRYTDHPQFEEWVEANTVRRVDPTEECRRIGHSMKNGHAYRITSSGIAGWFDQSTDTFRMGNTHVPADALDPRRLKPIREDSIEVCRRIGHDLMGLQCQRCFQDFS